MLFMPSAWTYRKGLRRPRYMDRRDRRQDGNGGYSQNGAGRGLRGTFAHGSMLDVWLVECGREKLTFGELLFAPFA